MNREQKRIVVGRRRFLQTTGGALTTAALAGCGGKRAKQPKDKAASMKHERADQLQELYGIEFPDDFFEFWRWYNQLPKEIARRFQHELGIGLSGPFDVLAGRFDNFQLRYPAVLHWRYQFDPPEFFTVLTGDTDALHWGYWFDDPGRLPPVVAAWYANDAFELWTAGNTLFDAIHDRIEGVTSTLHEYMETDPDYADDYRASLAAVSQLQKMLPAASGLVQRTATNMTAEQMGVVLPRGAGDLLLRGKQLWFDGDPQRFDVLEQAYRGLDRGPLAAVVRAHGQHPQLPYVDLLKYQFGDFHSIDEALAEPEQVRRLELGKIGLKTLPDLSALTELEELALWGNELTDLPPSLAKCSKLRSINLHGNSFGSIPAVLYELSQLEEVKLGNNQIQAVDERIERLRKLKELVLVGNPIPEADRAAIRAALPDTELSF